MSLELRCHTFYSPDDYEVESLEEARQLAEILVKHHKAYPCDVVDVKTGKRVALINLTENDMIFWLQEGR